MPDLDWYNSPRGLRERAAQFEFRARMSRTPGYRFIWARKANALRNRADIIEARERISA